MLDHITVRVRDYARSKRFYLAALAPLGYEVLEEFSQAETPELPAASFCGLGADGHPDLWLRPAETVTPTHVAFRARSRDQVQRFHAAAIAAGGEDHGKPGLRPEYHPTYYGAFVLDPDGYNLEVVCHGSGDG